jgi:hypothetical protein
VGFAVAPDPETLRSALRDELGARAAYLRATRREIEEVLVGPIDDLVWRVAAFLGSRLSRVDKRQSDGDLASLPAVLKASARLNQSLAASSSSARSAIERQDGRAVKKRADERDLRRYERALVRRGPETFVELIPTPLVKLNDLMETSVDRSFATFETRRVNWHHQLDLERVGARSRKGAKSDESRPASYDSEYRGSSAYTVSDYPASPPLSPRALRRVLGGAPAAEAAASPASPKVSGAFTSGSVRRASQSPNAKRRAKASPRSSKASPLEVLFATNPRALRPVRCLSRHRDS